MMVGPIRWMIGQARQSTIVIPSGARHREVADRALSRSGIWWGGDQELSSVFAQPIAAPIAPVRVDPFSARVGVRYQVIPTLALHGAV